MSYFQFGGKLIKFTNEKKIQDSVTQGPQQFSCSVTIEQVMTLPILVERSTKLEDALKSGSLEQYCYEKVKLIYGCVLSNFY